MLNKSILVLEHNVSDFLFLVEELSSFGYSEPNFYYCKNLQSLADPAVAGFAPTFIFVHLNVVDSPSPLDTFLSTQKLFPDIPIVIVAQSKDDEVALRCIELGAQSILEKGSFGGKQLVNVMAYSSERQKLRLELEKLKEDYQNLFNENPLALLVVDTDTLQIADVNKAAIYMYGYSHQEFTHLTLQDLIYKEQANGIESYASKNLPYSCHLNRKNERIYVDISKSRIVYKNITSELITVKDITEKVLAEEKDREAKKRLDAIFNGTLDAILLTDSAAKFVQVNNAACRMLEFSQEEFLSLSVADIVVKMQADDDESLWDKFLNSGSQTGIIELRTKTGTIITCHYNATANVLPGIHLSILTNITERELARKKIEEQGKRIESILENVTDGFFAVDRNWIVKYWNKAAEQWLEIPRQQVLGYHLWDVFKDAVNLLSYKEYLKAMNENIAVHFEDYYPALNKWFDVSAYPGKDGITVYFKDISNSKKQAIETLEARNNQAALINSTQDLIWSIDTEMKLVTFNTAYKTTIEETSDIEVEEGMQLPFNYHHAGSKDQWKNFYLRGLAGEAFDVVIPVLNPVTGKIKQAEVHFNPIFSIGTTTVKGLACYSHNITKQLEYQSLIEAQNQQLKLHEADLERLTRKLEKIMNSSLDIICSIDKDGIFVQLSEASINTLGYTPGELIGKNYREVIDPAYEEATKKANEEAMSGKSFTNFQNVLIHKNGTPVPLIWSKRWDKEEQIMFCVARDASALIEAERVQAENEQRFAALLQKGADMIFIINQEGQYTYASSNVKTILGFDPTFLVKLDPLFLIHPEDKHLAERALEQVYKQDEVKIAAFRHQNAAGEWRWIETIGTNQLHNPAIKGIVVNSRDITERKERETEREQMIMELMKTNADLKQFSFITSHNLRAPLSNITGILNIIDYLPLSEYNRQMMEMIETSTKQLAQTIDDLAKILIIKNNVSIEITRINLSNSIQDIKKIFLNTLNDVCADIEMDLRVPEIYFNKIYFESIIVNLLSNAIKYRSHHRNLFIKISSMRAKDGSIILQFSDNGSGMDVNMHRSKIFGLYQRFHDNTEGHGLGLFIIKSQIVALGGKIDVESEPEKGTTFIITFTNLRVTSQKEEYESLI